MGVGLNLCVIDGGDYLQLDLLPAASTRERKERRDLRARRRRRSSLRTFELNVCIGLGTCRHLPHF
jgi:hypothetical protein